MTEKRLKVAVIGAGVAGITTAYLLDRKHEVTLYEKNDYVGGHTNTIVINRGPDEGTPVDTGFIVLNDRNYPTLNRFLVQLDVQIRKSDMSFSLYCEKSGLQYSSNFPDGFFAQRKNLWSVAFWKMVYDILKFNKKARLDLQNKNLGNVPLGEYLNQGNFSKQMIENYIIPMGAAIWSARPQQMFEFPASTFIRFFENHGLLTLKDRPQWYSVIGGSHTYVKKFLKGFKGTVITNSNIDQICRIETGIAVRMTDHTFKHFDCVIIATHTDEALTLLSDPSNDEKRLLGAWTYEKNHAVLHTDPSVMPPNKHAWASWNYTREKSSKDSNPVSVSYDMNRLQGLQTKNRYFVTLNRTKSIPSEHIIREINYTHPSYTFQSINTQKELPKLNGVQNTFFCGSYFGYGFHEDAVQSGTAVARAFGIEL